MTENFERPDWVQQMEPVLETVNEGVLIADDCRRVVFVNAGFVRMTGLRDLVGNAARLFYTDEEWAFGLLSQGGHSGWHSNQCSLARPFSAGFEIPSWDFGLLSQTISIYARPRYQ